MLITGASFAAYIIGVHTVAVLVAFGPLFAFPLMTGLAGRREPRMLPFVYRLQQAIGRRLIAPGLLVVLVAGIYLASDFHLWKRFFVGWGLAVVVILGGLHGAVLLRQEGRLATLAERDIEAAGGGEVSLGADYRATERQHAIVGAVMALLVVATVIIMAVNRH
jgi:hypothetical protein